MLEVEVPAAAESQVMLVVILSVPPVQLSRAGTPPRFSDGVLMVPPLRLMIEPVLAATIIAPLMLRVPLLLTESVPELPLPPPLPTVTVLIVAKPPLRL